MRLNLGLSKCKSKKKKTFTPAKGLNPTPAKHESISLSGTLSRLIPEPLVACSVSKLSRDGPWWSGALRCSLVSLVVSLTDPSRCVSGVPDLL